MTYIITLTDPTLLIPLFIVLIKFRKSMLIPEN